MASGFRPLLPMAFYTFAAKAETLEEFTIRQNKQYSSNAKHRPKHRLME